MDGPTYHRARVWVLTDGKIGDDVQCLAVARALTADYEKRVVAPGPLAAAAAPWGPVDPKDRPDRVGSPIHGAPPDIVIASGRRAIPYARTVKAASGERTLIVIMKDPRVGREMADVIWAPAHDRLNGDNVFTTLTSPHGLAPAIAIAREKAASPAPKPMLGVLLGGPSGGALYDRAAARTLAETLDRHTETFASLFIVPSRRTPPRYLEDLRGAISRAGVHFWDGAGDNPYIDVLAHADALLVSADSHNMMSEAVSTTAGVYAYRPSNMASKLAWFVDQLEAQGRVRPIGEALTPFAAEPIDATDEIVAEIDRRITALRAV